jgi:hypothetical protein
MAPPNSASKNLEFTPWNDPLIDRRGVSAFSPYVDLFWLPVLGPSATALLKIVNIHFLLRPDNCAFGHDILSAVLGLGAGSSRNAPLPRAINRCVRFGLAKRTGSDSIAMRRFVSPISQHHLSRLPPVLQDRHSVFLEAVLSCPDASTGRDQAPPASGPSPTADRKAG